MIMHHPSISRHGGNIFGNFVKLKSQAVDSVAVAQAAAGEAYQIHPRGKSTFLRMESWARRGSELKVIHGSTISDPSIATLLNIGYIFK